MIRWCRHHRSGGGCLHINALDCHVPREVRVLLLAALLTTTITMVHAQRGARGDGLVRVGHPLRTLGDHGGHLEGLAQLEGGVHLGQGEGG